MTVSPSLSSGDPGHSDGQLLQTELSNGLAVLVQETRAAPVASFWVWYRVGSRNEHLGITGISHWVEHMLFKGTPAFPKGAAERAIARQGGVFNGATWYDFTTFYTTLPAERIELSLRIEADRMVNAVFDPEEVEAERSVIVSERQGAENSPEFLLYEELMGSAFRVHPYGSPTIGHMCDLETITWTHLHDYYRAHYVPNNALVVAVGDLDGAAMLTMIEEHFGEIPRGDDGPPVTAVEPQQRGERRVVVRREGSVPYLTAAFRAPAVRDHDFFGMAVLNAILTGASAMTFLGGGLTNKSSRLYKALVDRELAVDVSGTLLPTIDPFVYTLSVVVRPGCALGEVEEVLNEELARLKTDQVAPQEVEKAIKQAQAQFAYSSESVTGRALWLGFSEIFADHSWAQSYLDNLSAVTVEDVRRVADRYLRHYRQTVGWYVPESDTND